MKYLALLLLAVVLAGCSSPDLLAQESTKEYIPGYITPTYTFNATVPGPILTATVGELFELQIKNTLPEPITIHWHGVRVPNDMDGVPGVTQKPIKPGRTFTYSFIPKDAGVYWYHSHVDTHKQVEMGLQGVFLVDDPNIHIPSDSTHVLVLDDVALNQDGSYKSFDPNYMHGRFGNILLVNGQTNPTILSQGSKHRFQIVNTANARSFTISFANNPVTVYATDIGYDKPYTTQILTLHPGERYDVVVEANTSFDLTYVSRQSTRLARIQVTPLAYSAEKTLQLPKQETLVDEQLYTQEPEMTLSLQGVKDAKHGLVWQINGTDSLTNLGVFDLKQGITKVRVYNTQGQPHPMHLHGQQFVILSRNGVRQEATWKDTVMVGSRETVDIAVLAQEPGDWVFHCHILEHAKAGMLAIMQVQS
jgi:FtsP/CotA-like multicopper oxidase with cupredoxin domain